MKRTFRTTHANKWLSLMLAAALLLSLLSGLFYRPEVRAEGEGGEVTGNYWPVPEKTELKAAGIGELKVSMPSFLEAVVSNGHVVLRFKWNTYWLNGDTKNYTTLQFRVDKDLEAHVDKVVSKAVNVVGKPALGYPVDFVKSTGESYVYEAPIHHDNKKPGLLSLPNWVVGSANYCSIIEVHLTYKTLQEMPNRNYIIQTRIKGMNKNVPFIWANENRTEAITFATLQRDASDIPEVNEKLTYATAPNMIVQYDAEREVLSVIHVFIHDTIMISGAGGPAYIQAIPSALGNLLPDTGNVVKFDIVDHKYDKIGISKTSYLTKDDLTLFDGAYYLKIAGQDYEKKYPNIPHNLKVKNTRTRADISVYHNFKADNAAGIKVEYTIPLEKLDELLNQLQDSSNYQTLPVFGYYVSPHLSTDKATEQRYPNTFSNAAAVLSRTPEPTQTNPVYTHDQVVKGTTKYKKSVVLWSRPDIDKVNVINIDNDETSQGPYEYSFQAENLKKDMVLLINNRDISDPYRILLPSKQEKVKVKAEVRFDLNAPEGADPHFENVDREHLKEGILHVEVPENQLNWGDEGYEPNGLSYQNENRMPKDPSCEGYVFKGWWTGTDNNGLPFNETMPVEKTKTVYAKWVKSYKIAFFVEGVEQTEWTLTGEEEQSIPFSKFPTLPADKNGNAFLGWNTSEDGTGLTIDDATGFSNIKDKIDGDGTLKLYPVFAKAKTYTLDFKDGEIRIGKMSPKKFEDGENVKVFTKKELTESILDVKVYDNHLSDAEFKVSAVYEIDGESFEVQKPTGQATNTNLVIPLKAKVYKISYKEQIDKGTLTDMSQSENPTVYTYTQKPFQLKPVEKDGYRFLGWKAEGSKKDYGDIVVPYERPEDKIYIAGYERIYRIVYEDMGDMENSDELPTEFTVSSAEIRINKTPQKAGCSFLRWEVEGKDSGAILTINPADSAMRPQSGVVHVKAVWKQNYVLSADPFITIKHGDGTDQKPATGTLTSSLPAGAEQGDTITVSYFKYGETVPTLVSHELTQDEINKGYVEIELADAKDMILANAKGNGKVKVTFAQVTDPTISVDANATAQPDLTAFFEQYQEAFRLVYGREATPDDFEPQTSTGNESLVKQLEAGAALYKNLVNKDPSDKVTQDKLDKWTADMAKELNNLVSRAPANPKQNGKTITSYFLDDMTGQPSGGIPEGSKAYLTNAEGQKLDIVTGKPVNSDHDPALEGQIDLITGTITFDLSQLGEEAIKNLNHQMVAVLIQEKLGENSFKKPMLSEGVTELVFDRLDDPSGEAFEGEKVIRITQPDDMSSEIRINVDNETIVLTKNNLGYWMNNGTQVKVENGQLKISINEAINSNTQIKVQTFDDHGNTSEEVTIKPIKQLSAEAINLKQNGKTVTAELDQEVAEGTEVTLVDSENKSLVTGTVGNDKKTISFKLTEDLNGKTVQVVVTEPNKTSNKSEETLTLDLVAPAEAELDAEPKVGDTSLKVKKPDDNSDTTEILIEVPTAEGGTETIELKKDAEGNWKKGNENIPKDDQGNLIVPLPHALPAGEGKQVKLMTKDEAGNTAEKKADIKQLSAEAINLKQNGKTVTAELDQEVAEGTEVTLVDSENKSLVTGTVGEDKKTISFTLAEDLNGTTVQVVVTEPNKTPNKSEETLTLDLVAPAEAELGAEPKVGDTSLKVKKPDDPDTTAILIEVPTAEGGTETIELKKDAEGNWKKGNENIPKDEAGNLIVPLPHALPAGEGKQVKLTNKDEAGNTALNDAFIKQLSNKATIKQEGKNVTGTLPLPLDENTTVTLVDEKGNPILVKNNPVICQINTTTGQVTASVDGLKDGDKVAFKVSSKDKADSFSETVTLDLVAPAKAELGAEPKVGDTSLKVKKPDDNSDTTEILIEVPTAEGGTETIELKKDAEGNWKKGNENIPKDEAGNLIVPLPHALPAGEGKQVKLTTKDEAGNTAEKKADIKQPSRKAENLKQIENTLTAEINGNPAINPSEVTVTLTNGKGEPIKDKNNNPIMGTVNNQGQISIPLSGLNAGVYDDICIKVEESGKTPSLSDRVAIDMRPMKDRFPVNNLPEIQEVDNAAALNGNEKDQIRDSIVNNNKNLPKGIIIEVADDGTTTIKYPDNSQKTIPGSLLVRQKVYGQMQVKSLTKNTENVSEFIKIDSNTLNLQAKLGSNEEGKTNRAWITGKYDSLDFTWEIIAPVIDASHKHGLQANSCVVYAGTHSGFGEQEIKDQTYLSDNENPGLPILDKDAMSEEYGKYTMTVNADELQAVNDAIKTLKEKEELAAVPMAVTVTYTPNGTNSRSAVSEEKTSTAAKMKNLLMSLISDREARAQGESLDLLKLTVEDGLLENAQKLQAFKDSLTAGLLQELAALSAEDEILGFTIESVTHPEELQGEEVVTRQDALDVLMAFEDGSQLSLIFDLKRAEGSDPSEDLQKLQQLIADTAGDIASRSAALTELENQSALLAAQISDKQAEISRLEQAEAVQPTETSGQTTVLEEPSATPTSTEEAATQTSREEGTAEASSETTELKPEEVTAGTADPEKASEPDSQTESPVPVAVQNPAIVQAMQELAILQQQNQELAAELNLSRTELENKQQELARYQNELTALTEQKPAPLTAELSRDTEQMITIEPDKLRDKADDTTPQYKEMSIQVPILILMDQPQHRVRFDLNGGTGEVPEDQYGTKGEMVNLPDGTGLEKANFSFAGWASAETADSALPSYAFTSARTVTLYAVWLPKTEPTKPSESEPAVTETETGSGTASGEEVSREYLPDTDPAQPSPQWPSPTTIPYSYTPIPGQNASGAGQPQGPQGGTVSGQVPLSGQVTVPGQGAAAGQGAAPGQAAAPGGAEILQTGVHAGADRVDGALTGPVVQIPLSGEKASPNNLIALALMIAAAALLLLKNSIKR